MLAALFFHQYSRFLLILQSLVTKIVINKTACLFKIYSKIKVIVFKPVCLQTSKKNAFGRSKNPINNLFNVGMGVTTKILCLIWVIVRYLPTTFSFNSLAGECGTIATTACKYWDFYTTIRIEFICYCQKPVVVVEMQPWLYACTHTHTQTHAHKFTHTHAHTNTHTSNNVSVNDHLDFRILRSTCT